MRKPTKLETATEAFNAAQSVFFKTGDAYVRVGAAARAIRAGIGTESHEDTLLDTVILANGGRFTLRHPAYDMSPEELCVAALRIAWQASCAATAAYGVALDALEAAEKAAEKAAARNTRRKAA